eukprot:gnl/TRDRNA2_/TRDRNA2_148661_c0_seq3.p4 gnl/TRDRNA2_/TRDRNA2_148661_c0~~gnl/TRDRNA2_/TRDRNA2_148661_c0_seq3.p4  ORF type:complete len:107 (+),score=27.85 gnl/TRDRNA2_/TRDRNA2_148661_c0_seq3:577-897(+)
MGHFAPEMSLPGSKPPIISSEVQTPFDEKTAQEVAARRVISKALPMETASLIASQIGSGSLEMVMVQLAHEAQRNTVFPMAAGRAANAGIRGSETKEPKKKKAKTG